MPLPIVNPRGRPPRQIEWGDEVVNSNPGTPVTGGITTKTPGALTLYAESGFALEFTEQPSESVQYINNAVWYPAMAFTHARICQQVVMSGASSAEHFLEYSTNPGDTGSWTSAADGFAISATLGSTGSIRGGWYPLVSGARADVCWRVRARNGDDTASPQVSEVEVEFIEQRDPPMEKWYWRDLVPSDQPEENTIVLGVDPPVEDQTEYTGWLGYNTSRSFALCVPPLEDDSFTSPTEADVQDDAKVLQRARASGDLFATTFAGGGVGAHKDISGWVGRLVGPPLAAQAVPSFTTEHWFVAVAPSAFTDGTVYTHLWVWRPGVGRVLLGLNGDDPYYAESFSGGFGEKYVRFIERQCRNRALFPAFAAQANDRFVLDVATRNICDCGFLSTNQGLGTWVSYNGTVEPDDPEGFGDTFPGVASYTLLPRLVYLGTI